MSPKPMSWKVFNISTDEHFQTSHGNLALVVTTATMKVLFCGQMDFHAFLFVAINTVMWWSTREEPLTYSLQPVIRIIKYPPPCSALPACSASPCMLGALISSSSSSCWNENNYQSLSSQHALTKMPVYIHSILDMIAISPSLCDCKWM